MKSITGGTVVDLPLRSQSMPELARPVDKLEEMTHETPYLHGMLARSLRIATMSYSN